MVEVLSGHKTKMVSAEKNMLSTMPKEPRTIDELLRSRVASIPNKPIIGYPRTEYGCSDYVYYTPRQLDRFANGSMDILIHEGLQPNVCYARWTSIAYNAKQTIARLNRKGRSTHWIF